MESYLRADGYSEFNGHDQIAQVVHAENPPTNVCLYNVGRHKPVQTNSRNRGLSIVSGAVTVMNSYYALCILHLKGEETCMIQSSQR